MRILLTGPTHAGREILLRAVEIAVANSKTDAPLTLVSSEADSSATHVVLFANGRDAEEAFEALEPYRANCKRLGLPVIAELYLDALRLDDEASMTEDGGLLQSTIHRAFESDELSKRSAIRSLADMLIRRAESTNYKVLPIVRELMAGWRAKLGDDIELDLGGSIVSDTMVLDDAVKIDVDLRFLVTNPDADGLIERIESATGLKYRKTIQIEEFPDGLSNGHMIEGQIHVPGLRLPLDIEGCLRNRRRVNWHQLYLQVFNQAELERYRRAKRQFRSDKAQYKRVKSAMRAECLERALEKGLLSRES